MRGKKNHKGAETVVGVYAPGMLQVISVLSFLSLTTYANPIHHLNGSVYAVGRGVESKDVQAMTAVIGSQAAARLEPPRRLVATVSKDTATFNWEPPAPGAVGTGYLLEASLTSGGQVIASLLLPTGAHSGFTVRSVPNGIYYVHVRTVGGEDQSAASNQVMVSVGPAREAACSSAPDAPGGISGAAAGAVVSLNWAPPPAGCGANGYVVLAGSRSGLGNLAQVSVGPATTLTANAPNGTYFIRVIAFNAYGSSPPSNELVITVGGACQLPSQPSSPMVTQSGSDGLITWEFPANGGGATHFLVHAGSTPGAVDRLNASTGSVTSFVWASPPSGTSFVRITPINRCGAGPTSPERSVNFGAEQGWLAQVNVWRSRAGLNRVTEDVALSARDVLHARYSVKEDVLEHGENSASPWYTTEGRDAARVSSGAGNSNAAAPDSFAIEGWVQAPFHALGMLDPRLQTVGYGSYREADGGLQMSGWLDTGSGRGTSQAHALPIAFPGNGSRIPIPSAEICPPGRACFWGETPSPLTSCPGYSAPAGLPLTLQFTPPAFTSPTPPVVTASSLLRNGTPVEICVFTGGTYTNPDAASQSVGRSILTAYGAVVIVPRSPLPAGASYTATVTSGGQTFQWTFEISAGPPGDKRTEWAHTAVPPSFVPPRFD
ncbi:MAG: hypothetical protein H0T71_02145 [Acidobacteria bacterium]|nr:hypothetical protein [Acidobacteriota bacterium]